MSEGAAKTVIGVLVVFHAIVTRVIALLGAFFCFSSDFQRVIQERPNSLVPPWLHFVYMGCGQFGPFFGDLQVLIGVLFGAPIFFKGPSLHHLLVNKRKAESWRDTFSFIGPINAAVSSFFLCILTPLFCILGTWDGIAVQSLKT